MFSRTINIRHKKKEINKNVDSLSPEKKTTKQEKIKIKYDKNLKFLSSFDILIKNKAINNGYNLEIQLPKILSSPKKLLILEEFFDFIPNKFSPKKY